jgi:hypothetical protein
LGGLTIFILIILEIFIAEVAQGGSDTRATKAGTRPDRLRTRSLGRRSLLPLAWNLAFRVKSSASKVRGHPATRVLGVGLTAAGALEAEDLGVVALAGDLWHAR